jgi:hypothetical protein
MFPRIASVKRGSKTYKYLQIVEAYRADGRTTQRVVANLGRLDQLGDKLDDLRSVIARPGNVRPAEPAPQDPD